MRPGRCRREPAKWRPPRRVRDLLSGRHDSLSARRDGSLGLWSPTMGPRRVTVLMSVWNGGAPLLPAIRSVLGQAPADLALIVAMRRLDREALSRLEAWLAEVA